MPEHITIRVPATSANLGCAFDSAALALALFLDLHLAPRADGAVRVRYQGVNPERIPADDSNLIVRVIQETLDLWHQHRGFDLEINNQIPVGVGLGSSAAAIVGALAAVRWLADMPLSNQELVTMASRREGHPDNVAAAWHGGFTVSIDAPRGVLAYSYPVPDTVQLVLVVPDYALPTEKARQVLPSEYSRGDAIHNLQRAVVMAAHLASGKPELHREFFHDRWHQPYRAPLVPGLTGVLALDHPDLLGICLSGAGPSILAFVRSSAGAIGDEIRQALLAEGVHSEVRSLATDNLGAKGWSRPEGDEGA